MPSEEDTSVLAVLLDTSAAWAQPDFAALPAALEQLLIFLNAYQLMSAANQVTVMTFNNNEVEVLWPPPNISCESGVVMPSDAHDLRVAVMQGVARTMSASSMDGNGPLLSAALLVALCRLRRATRAQTWVQPRMLVVHASVESPTMHLAIMNSIFAAQKLGVLIDAVDFGMPSMMLQQAAFLTGGFYKCVALSSPLQHTLAQYLIMHCLPDLCGRRFVSSPPAGQLETRALCFQSRQPVQIGFACSVCLAVFSDDKKIRCPICDSRFKPHGQLPLSRPRKASTTSGVAAASTPMLPPSASPTAITVPPPPDAGQMVAWQLAPASAPGR